MITINRLNKAFGARRLFIDADLQIWARDRVALVGPNGSGKTTLLEMVAGDQEPDSGTIRIAKDVVIGYLRQETDELRGRTLLEETLRAGSEVTATGHRLEILEREMADTSLDKDERDRLVAEYGRLQDRFATLGGYTLEADAKRVLAGLGFGEKDLERLTDTFSGGWLMRVALAKLLLAQPDLLMLDEPTNHLDVESVEWFERFLSSYEGAVLLISHDRDFIDGVATQVVEIDERKLVNYHGNYGDFVRQRAAVAEQRAAAAKQQSREIAKTEDFINRFRYKASKAKQVQSRIKALEKVDRVHVPTQRKRKMNLAFPQPPRSGRVVIELEDLHFDYPENPVYAGLNLAMERDQKIALVGPNGAGKTTLLKLIAGVLKPQGGNRHLGYNVELGYFAQHQIEALEPGNRVLEELQRSIPSDVDIRPRDLLGRFLFSGDDIDKPVSVLSGGEKTRLAMAKLLVQPFNLLCLDEPTNHLDMISRDVLEDALEVYSGAMVLITHDRHLIRSIANNIVEVVDGRVTWFHGDYDYYLDRRERSIGPDEALATPADPSKLSSSKISAGPKSKERRRVEAEARARTKTLRDKITKIERELDQVAAELARLDALLADPDVYRSDLDLPGLLKEYERAKKRTKALESSWEEATSALQDADLA